MGQFNFAPAKAQIQNDPGAKTSIVDLVYPVGSIYMSVASTSPAVLFGGTWEQLKDKFLLGAGGTYTAGDTGGAASQSYTPAGSVNSHTLTTTEIPSHAHGLNSHKHSVGAHSHGLNSHKHSVGAHSHGLNSHTHGLGGHTHTGPSHTHTGPSHTHTGPSHSHSFSASGNNSGVSTSAGHKYVGFWQSDAGTGSKWAVCTPGSSNSGVNSYLTVSGTTGAAGTGATGAAGTGATGAAGTGNTGGNSGSTGAASGSTANSTAFDSGAASGSTANSTAFDSGAASGNTANAGGGGGHTHGFTGTAATISTLPPYLTVYMWKRSA